MIYEYNIKEAHSLQNLFVIFKMYKKYPLNLILCISYNLNSGFQRFLNCPRFCNCWTLYLLIATASFYNKLHRFPTYSNININISDKFN